MLNRRKFLLASATAIPLFLKVEEVKAITNQQLFTLLGGVSQPAGGGTTAFTLTDVASGRVFQRTKALTTGPVSASGTYTGSAPNAVELQVLKVSDNSIVKDWTTAAATIGGGNWSATITGVNQGGSYYVKARPSNATALAKTGSNPFYIGIGILMYGQSNMARMSDVTVSSSPPSASAGTSFYDGANWVAVPASNGVRELLNAVAAGTGLPCFAVNAALTGASINILVNGSTQFSTVVAPSLAAVGDIEFVLWHQGEGDVGASTDETTYKTALDGLHGDIATLVGRTKTELPWLLASLGNTQNGNSFATQYATIEHALYQCSVEQTNVVYSHSNRDVIMASASPTELHWDAASYGRAGKRYAQSILVKLGIQSNYPRWFATAAQRVSGTQTDLVAAHSMGTDFTPTTGITGIEVSTDGSSWSAVSAAVRQSATSIRVTHADFGLSARQLRYQYYSTADVTGAAKDNGSLNSPLNWTVAPLASDAAANPVDLSFQGYTLQNSAASSYTFNSVAVGAADSTRRIVVGVVGRDSGTTADISSVTVNGSAAALVTDGTTSAKLRSTGANINIVALYVADVPTGTTATVVVNFNKSIARCGIHIYRLLNTSSQQAANVATTTAYNGTMNLTVPSSGATLGVSVQSTASQTSLSNLTQDNLDTTTTLRNWSAHNTVNTGSQSFQFLWQSSSTEVGSIVAAWGP